MLPWINSLSDKVNDYLIRLGIKKKNRFKKETIFIDMATDKIFVRSQINLETEKILFAKTSFEQDTVLYRMKIKYYYTNNNIFISQNFITKIYKSEQKLIFSGIGVHYQNRIAERVIGTVVKRARTQLFYIQLC